MPVLDDKPSVLYTVQPVLFQTTQMFKRRGAYKFGSASYYDHNKPPRYLACGASSSC